MQIHASIKFDRLDLEEEEQATREAMYEFDAQPCIKSFVHMLEIMKGIYSSVPFGDRIELRLSLTEHEDQSCIVSFASTDDSDIEETVH